MGREQKNILERMGRMKKILQKSIFICFEGIAGSGKTTQIALLKKKLEKGNWGEVIITKTYEGKIKEAASAFIKALNLDPRSISMMFLFQALHAEQYKKTKEALESGKIVIADRWNESFWAYHSNFLPLSQKPKKMLKILDELAFQKLEPQITFLLDASEETALQRILLRNPKDMIVPEIGTKKFFIPIEPKKFFTIQRKYYLETARQKNWIIINADDKSIKNIHNFIWRILLSKLKELGQAPNSFLFLILILIFD